MHSFHLSLRPHQHRRYLVGYSISVYHIAEYRSEKPSTKPPTAYDARKIVPATGWVFDGKGHVTLISHASNANNLGSTPACQKK
ncbi:MAG: hypothetical protein KME57_27290 [Scytonema hyalinum WJT4-NPBG1]|nr:hypothetical protein [Scytonema hyalinum WJT4-NPBG1]